MSMTKQFRLKSTCAPYPVDTCRDEVVAMNPRLLSAKDKSRILSLKPGQSYVDSDGDKWTAIR